MRAAIYRRISRDREGRELGVERQEADCRELADQMGVEVAAVLTDNDLSASTRSRKPRPEYQRLLDGARTGQWGLIIAWSSSRLTRRPLELEAQIQLAEQHGTRYAYCKSPSFDLNTADGRATARTLAAWDAAEAERTAERLAAQKRQAAENGEWRGGRRPYGYEVDGVTVRPVEGQAIAWATRQVLLGASLRSLAVELNRRGEVTSTGRLWTATELRRVLLRARNAGLVEADGQVIGQAQWPAVVSQPEWEALVRVLGDPSRRTNQTNNARRWLGSGLYLCGVCDDGITVRCTSNPSRPGIGRAYYCRRSKHLTRRTDYTDRLVEATVLGYLARPEVAAQLVTTDAADDEVLTTRALELRNRLDEQAAAFGEGLLDRLQLARNTRKIRAELAEVERQQVTAAAGHPAGELVVASDILRAWRDLDVSRQQAVVDSLATVTLVPANRGRPAGWQPGQPYFDPATVRIDWRG